MKLEIVSDGSAEGTRVLINGKEQPRLLKFAFSVVAKKRARLEILEDVDGQEVFRSYYGPDFKHLDGRDSEVKGANSYVGGENRTLTRT
ncbi:MAG: hypothetical protein HOO67_06185 [Candidatus Peribacteraceae bacterium]|nr:hypothetical protein [Candidatus Peribacteraceae bacterium]